MRSRPKLLLILHRSPPAHGAGRVGDRIAQSRRLQEQFACRFITIDSSESIADIGRIRVGKLYAFVKLYGAVLWALVWFRPDRLYFTASVGSIAFYRDLLLSTLWKGYGLLTPLVCHYHYHTQGVKQLIASHRYHRRMLRFFVRGVKLILLAPELAGEFEQVEGIAGIAYLPNGIEDPLGEGEFEPMVAKRLERSEPMRVLYLAHMMYEKGYDRVLQLAKQTQGEAIVYHFAGSWGSAVEEQRFVEQVRREGLEASVCYHGFVSGEAKATLLREAHLLCYPTRNDAFPLTLLEALAYGLPILATEQGAIGSIVGREGGCVVSDASRLSEALREAYRRWRSEPMASACRRRYEEHFTLEVFESTLLNVLQ